MYRFFIVQIKDFITGKKKAPKRPKVPAGKLGDISLPVERRNYFRIKAKVIVNYIVYSPAGMKDGQTHTRDIGSGGICITTVNCITRNTIIELEIKIPDYGSTINALARVVYSIKRKTDDDFDTGVRFTDIPDEERKYIIDYVNGAIKGANMK